MRIYICSCVEEKNPNIRIRRFTLVDFFKCEYIKVFHNDDLYIMCPQIINFCYEANKSYFFGKTCAVTSRDNLFLCITALRLGMNSICSRCVQPLAKKLFPNLSKI